MTAPRSKVAWVTLESVREFECGGRVTVGRHEGTIVAIDRERSMVGIHIEHAARVDWDHVLTRFGWGAIAGEAGVGVYAAATDLSSGVGIALLAVAGLHALAWRWCSP